MIDNYDHVVFERAQYRNGPCAVRLYPNRIEVETKKLFGTRLESIPVANLSKATLEGRFVHLSTRQLTVHSIRFATKEEAGSFYRILAAIL